MDIIKKLPNDAVPIKNAIDHWIDRSGIVYAINKRNNQPEYLYKKVQYEEFGYRYCKITYRIDGKNKNIGKRVHRLVAEAFISNPNNLPCVGHFNNVKNDDRVENLYWTTVQENTQKAFNDGLCKNDIGIEDSQSNPCIMYDRKSNKILGVYGSISEANRETGIEKSTISRQCKYHRPVRKDTYFRYCTKETYLFYKCESTIESDK